MDVLISNKNDFLSAHIYYPGQNDKDWIELKSKISNTDSHHVSVQDIANLLISNPDFHNPLADEIRKLYDQFKVDMFKQEPIEGCPPIGDDYRCKMFIRNGNKRSIAYAMKLIKKEIEYEPVHVSWFPYFTRLDNNNLAGFETAKSQIE